MISTQPEVSPTVAAPAKRRAHKRADGEGSISQHASGMWRGRLMVGYKADGKPDIREVYGKTQAECRRKLRVLQQQVETGVLTGHGKDRETLAAYLIAWLDGRKNNLRIKTWDRYRQLITGHISPALGKTKLAALRPDDLKRFYNQKIETGLSPRTVRQMHAILHVALDQALKWGYVARNVVDAVDAPKFERFEWTRLDLDGVRLLLNAANDVPLSSLWATAAYSGCRQGELLGLRWQDVNLDAGTLSVVQTLVKIEDGKPILGEPKTKNSRRTIKMSRVAVDILRAHRQRQLEQRLLLGPDYTDYGLVFTDAIGRPLPARNAVRAFKAALRHVGLPETIRFHDLRHAHATLMFAQNVHPKAVSARLGHSTIAITMDLYTHDLPSLDADAADRLEQAIRG
jgi:integrase